MNEFNDFTPQDEQRFDRLVDGELSRDEYNDLLRSLDQQPDGWRRCALAFLEAQALRQEFGELSGEAEVSYRPATSAAADKRLIRRWPGVLAVAVSFLIAFGLGLMFRGGWPEAHSGTEGMPVAKDIEHPETPVDQPSDKTQLAKTPVPKAGQPGRYRGNVRLVYDRPDGSGSEAYETSVYDLSEDNAWMLHENRLRVPPEMRRLLQQMGGELRWDQQVMPFDTEDGQRVLIPIRQLELTPVGGRRYQ